MVYMKRQFASDNYAGICPAALDAVCAANAGHARPYGDDEWTGKACDLIREVFETDCEVFFVFNGTAANSLALTALCNSYHSIICHETAHIETDECGAPQFFTGGARLLAAAGENGRIRPAEVTRLVELRDDVHYPKPRVLSLTESTELGTVYTADDLAVLGEQARRHGLRLHMDGARFANAVASQDVHPADLSWRAGVDVLCFGGIKNGMSSGEAVVFFDHGAAEEFAFRCKHAGQLASKMRFVAAQWIGMLEGDVWLLNARHANAMARRLDAALREIPELRIMCPVEANAVFVDMPPRLIAGLHERGWHFYNFIGEGGVRLMCSWDMAEDDIEAFVGDVREILAG